MIIILFAILGLIIGSFLNVLVFRTKIEDSLLGRSYCPKCKKKIDWYDNIPVLSFIILGAQCRQCRQKISWQYPIVEIITAIVFALVASRFFSVFDPATWTITFYYLVTFSLLIAILVYDYLYMEIPGIILWPAIGFVVAFGLIFDWTQKDTFFDILELNIYSGALAAFLAFLFFFLLVTLSKERWMGMGDAYLVILLGLFAGWPKIFLGLFLAFFLGSIYGITLIAMKKKNMKSQVPFAPFLIIGTAIAVFAYSPITIWYFNLFSAY
ncbi:MAG: prepilin peptidase [Parcubacteria group bacterium]|jgi:prepilin signal peptidase PulO-like enzyme (type II secretory pathway)